MTKLGAILMIFGVGLLVYFGLVFRPKALSAPTRTALGRVTLPNSHFPDEVADRVVGILVGVGLLISGTILVARNEPKSGPDN